MGVKSVLAGIFLALFIPLLLMASSADGAVNNNVTKCLDFMQPNGVRLCDEWHNQFCKTLKCQRGEVNECGSPSAENADKEALCKAFAPECLKSGQGPIRNESNACQLCGTDLCNTGNLTDGGNWVPTTTTRATAPPPTTTTTTKARITTSPTSTGMASSDGSTTEGVTDGASGGHFGVVNWLLLIVAGLLVGLISQNAILLR